METPVVLSLGCNLGDRLELMTRMYRAVAALLIPPIRRSPLMETEPVDMPGEHPPFLNLIVAGGYSGDPFSLLVACQAIEHALGRPPRHERLASRVADVDILLFGAQTINDPTLIIPHPAILTRRFCLEGMRRIDPAMMHPTCGRTITECIHHAPSHIFKQCVRSIDREPTDE
jgi:2-amino-4-hydroxy-6-hydroxymethyldihydropteridine diphosphokinase